MFEVQSPFFRFFFFFFNDTATTEIYTLSLHDALPIIAIGFGPLLTPSRIRIPSPPQKSTTFMLTPHLKRLREQEWERRACLPMTRRSRVAGLSPRAGSTAVRECSRGGSRPGVPARGSEYAYRGGTSPA